MLREEKEVLKESKTRENNKKDKLVENENLEIIFGNNDPIDNKINEDIKEIKEKLNSENLSDEFKKNLQAKLEEEYNKTTSMKKNKIFDFPVVVRKLAGVCACLVILCSGCIAFADDIENIILHALGNTDLIVKKAIEEGNYREVDMEYVEHDGVSIKVDYIVANDKNLYIAFNVLAEEEFDNVFFENISIDVDGQMIHKRNEENIGNINRDFQTVKTGIKKNEIVYVYKIAIDENQNFECMNINIEKIRLIEDEKISNKENIWNLKI